ncbi:MAG: GNAT family N-acetyltransferase [candidate division Zixibacteria bacterium]|nr:GNAT family N-acetyltransferase [candidate division Zixibacteria bacterium]MDH3936154.1 GNAT family N-acetyltransferase [candidate division Zixibacteria bacterium]MDH4033795.1 GNAT family N-acetyltransferase [candidate division Zixibacteria bacterium]
MNQRTQAKADIVPFTMEYAPVVRSWIDSEETYKNLCRGKDYPPPEEIVESWQRDAVSSYILLWQRRPVAYGELFNRPLEMAVEITHLIVDPVKRCEGYGTKMLELLYNRAAARANVAKVVLNLYGDSEITLGCYLKAGFVIEATSSYTIGFRMARMVT